MMTRRWCLAINVLFPGAGLIGLQRTWVGTVLAGVFGLGVGGGLLFALVAPAMAPWAVTAALLTAGAGSWLAAQWLCWQRWRVFRQASAPGYVRAVCDEVDRMVATGQYRVARQVLMVALSENDESPDLMCRFARLASVTGPPSVARRAWRRLKALDRPGRFRRDIEHADRTLGL